MSFNKASLTATIAIFTGALLTTLFSSVAAAAGTAAAEESQPPISTPRSLRLLTTAQYANTIKYFFGPGIKVDVEFAPLARTDGLLAAGSAVAGTSASQIETYQKVASLVAAQVVSPERRATLIPCKPKSEKKADKACAARFLGDVTRYLYRRPPSTERLAELVEQAGRAADRLEDFYAGLQLTLEGVLLSPNVLFVPEQTEPDHQHPGQTVLDGYSWATRLSLFLWNAAPDAAVSEAAAHGKLDTTKGRTRVVDMMLASPRLEDGVRAFFDDMFSFSDFETLSVDPSAFPYFAGEALRDAREQTLRTVVDQLITKNKDYRDLYTTRETFISPALALIYGVPTVPGWRPIEFPPEAHREGILTQPSFLVLHSHPARTSPTLRGKALREILLCQQVPRPPPNVDFSIVNNPNSNFRTARERLTAHRANPVCAGCHRITDPMGLALENFDGAGKYRLTERGTPIDASGSLNGVNFTNVEGLAQALHDDPQLPKCLVRRAFSYAIGAPIPNGITPALEGLDKDFAAKGYRLRALLREIALSPEFLFVDEPDAKPAPPEKAANRRSSESARAGGKS